MMLCGSEILLPLFNGHFGKLFYPLPEKHFWGELNSSNYFLSPLTLMFPVAGNKKAPERCAADFAEIVQRGMGMFPHQAKSGSKPPCLPMLIRQTNIKPLENDRGVCFLNPHGNFIASNVPVRTACQEDPRTPNYHQKQREAKNDILPLVVEKADFMLRIVGSELK